MKKKILIISSDYNNFFFKPIIFKLKKYIRNLEIYIVKENRKTKLKRYFYILSMLNFLEIIDLIITIIKFNNQKKKYNYKFKYIENINSANFVQSVKMKKFDLVALFNCPQILKNNILNKLNIDITNFHPGIISNHRGLFPIFYAKLNKDNYIGLTFHKVIAKIDSGKIIDEIKIPIERNDGILKLYKKLYFSDQVFNFVKNSLLNSKLMKKNSYKVKISKYYSYPSLTQIIQLKLKKIFN